MKINWSFIEPVRDQAARLRGDFTAKSEIVKLAEQQAEIDRLRAENARLWARICEADEMLLNQARTIQSYQNAAIREGEGKCR